MELAADIFFWALAAAMVAGAAWAGAQRDRDMRKLAESKATQPRYAIVETIEPGMRVVQDRCTGRRVIVTDRGGAAEI